MASLVDRKEVTHIKFPTAEKPFTSYRISGLTDEQLDDLVARAVSFLEEC
jgi:hypothetical protein